MSTSIQNGVTTVTNTSPPAPKPRNKIQERLDNLPLSSLHWWIWGLCTLGLIFDSFDLYLISFAMPMILKEWNISSITAGWLASGAMWGMIIGAYLWGIIGDRIGRKTSLSGTILVYSLITGLSAWAWNTFSLFAARFAVGIGLGGLVPVGSAVEAELLPAKYRGRMMAASIVLWPLGGLLGAVVALSLAKYGWRTLFVVGALPALIVFITNKIIPESPRFLQSRGKHELAEKYVRYMEKKSGIAVPDGPIILDNTVDYKLLEEKPPSLMVLFSKKYIKRTILTWGIWFTQCLPYYALSLWLPTIMTKYYAVPVATSFKIMMGITGIGIIGRFMGMLLVDSWGRKPLMITFGILSGASILMYTQINSVTSLLIVACIAAFFYEGIWAGIAPYTAELYPTSMRTTAIGAATAFGRYAAAMGPVLVGYSVARSLNMLYFIFSASFIILAILVASLGAETAKKSLEEIEAGK